MDYKAAYCPECGTRNLIKPDSLTFFCSSCGKKVILNADEAVFQADAKVPNEDASSPSEDVRKEILSKPEPPTVRPDDASPTLPVNEDRAIKQAPEPVSNSKNGKQSKKNTKRNALIGAGIAVVVIAAGVGIGVPAYNISQGDTAMLAEDYNLAADFYNKGSLLDFDGAKAKQAQQGIDYTEGLETFQSALTTEDYARAAESFEAAGDFKEAQTYATCLTPFIAIANGESFSDEAYQKVIDTGKTALTNDPQLELDSTKLATFIYGYFEYEKNTAQAASKAKRLWSKLPEDYKLGSYKVTTLKEKAALIGKWKITKVIIKATQVGKTYTFKGDDLVKNNFTGTLTFNVDGSCTSTGEAEGAIKAVGTKKSNTWSLKDSTSDYYDNSIEFGNGFVAYVIDRSMLLKVNLGNLGSVSFTLKK